MLVHWFSVEHKGSISKASHVAFWFLQQYWCLIKAECCFPTSCSSRDPSRLCLSQHQLGSIRSPDNRRWHMPAFITKPAMVGSLWSVFVLKDLFVVTKRGRDHWHCLVFFFRCIVLVFARLTHSRLFQRAEGFLLTLHFSLSAINTMLLYWLGGPYPYQLFNTHICILNNLIIVIRT